MKFNSKQSKKGANYVNAYYKNKSKRPKEMGLAKKS